MNKQQRKILDRLQGELSQHREALQEIRDAIDEAKALPTDLEPLKALVAKVDDIRTEVESTKDDEQEKYDNMPESLQGGERGEKMQSAIDALEQAQNQLETFDSNAQDALTGTASEYTYETMVGDLDTLVTDLEDAEASLDEAQNA